MGLNGTDIKYHKCPPALLNFPLTGCVIMVFFLHFCFMPILGYQVRVANALSVRVWSDYWHSSFYLELITFGNTGNKVEPNLGTG